ncbi:protein CHROMOSOME TRANSMISSION FIDELITY 7 [Spinacia oleracea]|uniref:Protein CHROMOSOME TRANSMISSION FIDELITY 7 n=1 Tax=Spinacia oleracea TaxID=3562 RepID=A0A9R0ITS1_SPIOL|nr:protein CHROMOSOME TRANSMISSION FIDELITY 7 [Spinacia oleracea]
MQKTIESFFKQSSTPSSMPQTSNFNDLFDGIRAQNHPEIRIKYTRQPTRVGESTSDGLIEEEKNAKSEKSKGKILNKKRKYAQFHLELGQSDFLLHTCKICGMKYSKGDEIDEKVHSTFHKNYTHGIPFKGWRHERVVHLPALKRDRVIHVLNCDPPAQRKKVEEVVKMMEIELGDGWIFHELCQVYLFISSQRVAACMIVEPINTAHKLLSDSLPKIADGASGKKVIPKPKTLQFGEVCFQREVSRKGSNHRNSDAMDSNLLGSIVCEEEATPASCGIRAIWVSPSNRRKGIATHLLDAVRKSFCTNYVLERSQLAFSNPTSAGKALATNYTGTGSILVYKT